MSDPEARNEAAPRPVRRLRASGPLRAFRSACSLIALAATPTVGTSGSISCMSGCAARGTGELPFQPTDDAPTPAAAAGDAGVDAPSAPASDATALAPDATPACPSGALPTEAACVIADAYGIFVAPPIGGAAAGDGTRARPFSSIAAAVAAATYTKKRVYVCAGKYAESLEIVNGVSAFGYFDCAGGVWSVGTGTNASTSTSTILPRARIEPPAGPAAHANGVVAPTRVEGFELIAPDLSGVPVAPSTTGAAASSIALVAVASPGLTFVSTRFQAGGGQRGADGAVAEPPQMDIARARGGANRASAVCDQAIALERSVCTQAHAGGPGGTSVCTYASLPMVPAALLGGAGGRGGVAGSKSTVQRPSGIGTMERVTPPGNGGAPTATPATARGADIAAQTLAVAGWNGVDGADGTSGDRLGTLANDGYVPADGARGTDGAGGQGGGGGAGDDADVTPSALGIEAWGYSGAGGGAGGCAGPAGTPGRGGGASVGIVAIDSPFRIESSVVTTGSGGAGGSGQFGSGGTAGGEAGVATERGAAATPIWRGGPGGAGGRGGASGHGGPGPSIGIASRGAAPTLTGSTLAVGAAAPARPGLASEGHAIAATADGLHADTHAF